MEDIEIAKNRLKLHKSPGENRIRSKLLKWDNQCLNAYLLKVFNDSYNGTTPIPRAWIDAEVVSIYKRKGSQTDPATYRSIFLLDALGKLYASILCQRLRHHLAELSSRTQFKFCEGRSTE